MGHHKVSHFLKISFHNLCSIVDINNCINVVDLSLPKRVSLLNFVGEAAVGCY